MLIKISDDKAPQLHQLEALFERPDLDAEQKKRVESELRNLRSGIKGEKDSAYEIGFYLDKSKNWAVIHDLRLEHEGRIAQIDHILINRFLDVFVVETKNFNAGLSINERGEFTAWYGKNPVGIASPLAQNEKHIVVLRDAFTRIELPTRMGFTIKPSFHSVVMVAKTSRITRPKNLYTSNVIKADAISTWLQKDEESALHALGNLARVISSETLQTIAEHLAYWHKPITIDYPAKFGIRTSTQPLPPEEPRKPVPEPEEDAAAKSEPTRKLICCLCAAKVTYAVAKFCWNQKSRFGGKVYCFDCQKTVQ